MIRQQLLSDLQKALRKLGFDDVEPALDHPVNEVNGDYSSNVAMVLFRIKGHALAPAKGGVSARGGLMKTVAEFKTPLSLAQAIVKEFPACRQAGPQTDYLEKVEAVAPGFINFYLKPEFLQKQMREILEQKENFGKGKTLAGKKVMVEFGDPNTHKAFHIGHLRNINQGYSVIKLLEAGGAKVVHASYQGDVGMHIAKCLYGILHNLELKKQMSLVHDAKEKVNLIAKAYTEGSQAFEADESVKKETAVINKQIYAKDPQIFDLYQETRQWSLDYFETIYQRLDIDYEKHYFESEMYQTGKENVLRGLKEGIFQESQGAIIFPGEKYGLHSRVFVTTEGNPTYEGKDMALGPVQYRDSGNGLVIRVVGPEQAGYFQVVFEAQSQLFPELRGKFLHLISGWIKLKKGKMSSRTGQVVLGEWLLDETKERLQKQYKMSDKVAEVIAIGAVKYSMLKIAGAQEITFDIEESINLEGDSGPYLQYTYARTRSVMVKSLNPSLRGASETSDAAISTKKNGEIASPLRGLAMTKDTLEPEEISLLKALYQFPEVVESAGKNYSPNLLCTYLFDLAKRYNLFYNKLPILNATKQQGNKATMSAEQIREFRLALTEATGQVLKNGLSLLGIKVLERM